MRCREESKFSHISLLVETKHTFIESINERRLDIAEEPQISVDS